MKRLLIALLIGTAFVLLISVAGHVQLGTPVPFWLLSPGIFAGACVPDSHFNPEGDTQPWGPVSVVVVYVVNIAVYVGLAYLILYVASLSPQENSGKQGSPGRNANPD
jgi:hypothetical protein